MIRTSYTIKDQSVSFNNKADVVLDQALGSMAADIERLAKMKVPVRKGRLQSSIVHVRVAPKRFEVRAGFLGEIKYARKMEYVQFNHYTTPGTGSRYMRNSGATVARKSLGYLKEAASRVRP